MASRQLSLPKWCPSCSLALLRAFASACGTPLSPPTRRIGRSGYQAINLLQSRAGYASTSRRQLTPGVQRSRLRRRRPARNLNATADPSKRQGISRESLFNSTNTESNTRPVQASYLREMFESIDGSYIKKKDVHTELDPGMFDAVDKLQHPVIQQVMSDLDARGDIGSPLRWEKVTTKQVVEDLDRRIEVMRKKRIERMEKEKEEEKPMASQRDTSSAAVASVPNQDITTNVDVDKTGDVFGPTEIAELRIEGSPSRKLSPAPKAPATHSYSKITTENFNQEEVLEKFGITGYLAYDSHKVKTTKKTKESTEETSISMEQQSSSEAKGIISESEENTTKEFVDENELAEQSSESNEFRSLQEDQETLIQDIERLLENIDNLEEVIGEEKLLSLREEAELLVEEAEDLYRELLTEDLEGFKDLSTNPAIEPQIENDEQDIEFKVTETSTPKETSDGGTPWYLQAPMEPAPRRFVSPLIEQMPELPPNPPEHFEALMNYLLKDLSLSKLKVMDLRGIEPPPALGPNVLMILATARSERHMNIAADKCARYMRGILTGAKIFADGLMGRGEMKLRERRERRKGKRRTADDEEALRVGWICINSGQGIVVQVMTGWKREELNLEALWSRKINTSMKRKLREKLTAEGRDTEEIKRIVASKIPDVLDEAPEYDAREDRIEAKKIEKRIMAEEMQLPPPDSSQVGLEEYQDVFEAVEMHSKSRKKEEGRRYIDIPAVKPRRLSKREKERQLDGITFSTRRAFSTSTRHYGRVSEEGKSPLSAPASFPLKLEDTDPELEKFVRKGDYKTVTKWLTRPRKDTEATLVLLAHLNHLVLTQPEIARKTLLSENPDQRYLTPFFISFNSSLPETPKPSHNHIQTLLQITAHKIAPLVYPRPSRHRDF
ncbi:ATPase synthesis protein 25 mitochondrial, variant 2 [Orbilia ellipsospora]|uniref:ATPase synthesis protein 25 n=1 Tax=Orbilia ellipsospora TaxID=2528407 RepID=A0AAV9XRD1_9PEZI